MFGQMFGHITRVAGYVGVGTVVIGGSVLSIPLAPILVTTVAVTAAVGGTVVAVKAISSKENKQLKC